MRRGWLGILVCGVLCEADMFKSDAFSCDLVGICFHFNVDQSAAIRKAQLSYIATFETVHVEG